jgi:phage shock protein PspC (stress-responsive transcriptional regulator)
MKKTINITIQGVVFHIEEDGYEKLKGYLASIERYFASFEDSDEIVADIESRIAEKFLVVLRKDDKQAISLADVDTLIASMGSVADFEAIADDEDLKTSASPQNNTQTTENKAFEPNERQFVRDGRRKVLSGVCAGLAHYLNMDPVWIRVGACLLVFGIPFMSSFNSPFTAMGIITYFIFSIIVPIDYNLEEDKTVRKLFRDTSKKVIGGVASGLAKYMDWDVTSVRIAFICLIPVAAFGLVAYLVLWASTPEAKSLTDDMQMQGRPITLENIEYHIKALKADTTQPQHLNENPLTRLVMFPFRILGGVFENLKPAFGGLAGAGSVFIGILISITTVTACFALLMAMAALLGIISRDAPVYFGNNIPVGYFANDLKPAAVICAFLALFIPFLALTIAGVSLIARRNLFTSKLGQGLLFAWVFGVFGSFTTLIPVVREFKEVAFVEKTEKLTPTSMLSFDIDGSWRRNNYRKAQITLVGHDSSSVLLYKELSAKGKTEEVARKNAEEISYTVTLSRDSVHILPRNYYLPENARFRDQHTNITLRIPNTVPFLMTKRMAYFVRNVINVGDINWKNNGDSDGGVASFMFDKNGELKALDLEENDDNNDQSEETSESEDFLMSPLEASKSFALEGFDVVDISGKQILVEVKQGETFSVKAEANSNEDFQNLEIIKSDEDLVIRQKNDPDDVINVYITMPKIERITVGGNTKAIFKGFDDESSLLLRASGMSLLKMSSLRAKDLELDLSGKAQISLLGETQNLKGDLSGESMLDAYDLDNKNAKIDASGMSVAKINTKERLEATVGSNSRVLYKRKPQDVIKKGEGKLEDD